MLVVVILINIIKKIYLNFITHIHILSHDYFCDNYFYPILEYCFFLTNKINIKNYAKNDKNLLQHANLYIFTYIITDIIYCKNRYITAINFYKTVNYGILTSIVRLNYYRKYLTVRTIDIRQMYNEYIRSIIIISLYLCIY